MSKIESFDSCKLGRQAEADKLEKYIANVHKARGGSHTLNINAKWGEGKTHFLKRWKSQLEKNYFVVYWDAWSSDFSNDPLVSFFHVFIAALNERKEKVSGKNQVSQAIRKFLCRPVKIINICNDAISAVTGVNLQGVTERYLDDPNRKIIEEYGSDVGHIRTLTIELTALVENIEEEYLPIYILIDELDRCKPTYALTLLERVKHLFNIKGFQFVIATDTDQLQHTVKSIYGEKFDAQRYLKRFFDVQYTFPVVDRDKYTKQLFEAGNIDLEKTFYMPETWHAEDIFCDFAIYFGWTMRDQLQIFEKVKNITYLDIGSLHLVPLLFYFWIVHSFSKKDYEEIARLDANKNISILLKEKGSLVAATTKEYRIIQLLADKGCRTVNRKISIILNVYRRALELPDNDENLDEIGGRRYKCVTDFCLLTGGDQGSNNTRLTKEFYMNLAENMGGFSQLGEG